MANNYRVISAFRKDPQLTKLLKEIDNNFEDYNLGSNTPIPNQAFETASNKHRPICLYFSANAADKLTSIRQIAQIKSDHRLSSNKEDTPIEFLCTGYIDHSWDIVITNIIIPQISIYKENNIDPKEAILNSVKSKDANIELINSYYDYLKDSKINKKDDNIGIMPIALLGTTRPIIKTNDNTEYCPRLSEIAKAIMPANVEINHPIKSGILSVSPLEIVQTPTGKQYRNGSLECLMIGYEHNKNGTVSPNRFFNVTRCQQADKNGKLSIVDISKSKQPLKNLPILSQEFIQE